MPGRKTNILDYFFSILIFWLDNIVWPKKHIMLLHLQIFQVRVRLALEETTEDAGTARNNLWTEIVMMAVEKESIWIW